MAVEQSGMSETEARTVTGVWRQLLRHPVELLLRRWNWKSAVLSALIRGMLFFIANLDAGMAAAVGAMTIESAFYVSTAGFYGAFLQSFRRVTPLWQGMVTVAVVLPAINHSLEFLLHEAGGTARIREGMIASVLLSVFSATFNLFVMNRGALVVGSGSRSLRADLRAMPRLVIDYLLCLARLGGTGR